jgi:asparagine synthase (glutamine-hydrolysing)
MCGIAGVVDIKSMPADELVWRQLASLHHRGPDASGLHRGGAAVIGQSRLSIIDLVTGDPPITNEDGSIGVALNGEIYNFTALREELRSEGHHFTTTGDTEVVAHLAEK